MYYLLHAITAGMTCTFTTTLSCAHWAFVAIRESVLNIPKSASKCYWLLKILNGRELQALEGEIRESSHLISWLEFCV